MTFILAIIVCFIMLIAFWQIGQFITKYIKLKEENKNLNFITSIAFGISIFLITVNFFGNILRNFNLSLILALVLFFAFLFWQKEQTIKTFTYLKEEAPKKINSFYKSLSENKFPLLLISSLNLIFGIIAFSSTKIDRLNFLAGHVYFVNQLIAGNYPARYSFLPSLPCQFHNGTDILAATVSRFSGCHPEIVFDILLILFLNLIIFALCGISTKFSSNNPFSKYFIILCSFLAWGPITGLFTKRPGEVLPANLLENIIYLTKTRLSDSAMSTGLLLHWYFSPAFGISIFFFLIAIFLIYRFIEGERNLKFILALGMFLSVFTIIDISKLAILICGILIYFLFLQNPLLDELTKEKQTEWINLAKSIGIILLATIVLSLLYGNWIYLLSKNYINPINFYDLTNVGKGSLKFKDNIFFIVACIIGFYFSYKNKEKWTLCTLIFFVSGIVVSTFLSTLPEVSGNILMSTNFIGAFALLSLAEALEKSLNLTEKHRKAYLYSALVLVFSISTLMFCLFGDKDKPLLILENNSLKYTGLQKISSPNAPENGAIFLKHIRANKEQSILSEPEYSEFFAQAAGLFTPFINQNISNSPIKKEVIEKYNFNFNGFYFPFSFSFNNQFWTEQKIHWLYVTPRFLRDLVPPQARIRLLNLYFNDGLKSVFSYPANNNPATFDELFEVTKPGIISSGLNNKYYKSLSSIVKDKKRIINNQSYINQIIDCPYFGIYNSMSNDFNGNMTADIAFYDEQAKRWYSFDTKTEEESVIDLSNALLLTDDSDLLIPIPADYDGDSKSDIALFSRKRAEWKILRSSDNTLFTKVWGGLVNELPLPADLDGDSKTDIAVYTNDKEGRWPALLSSTNYTYADIALGILPLDIPLNADIDGDKKADHVIYRGLQKHFYIYPSSIPNNQNNPIQIPLGDENSRVVAEDFDGDGKADLATWTPKNGKWQIVLAKDISFNPATRESFVGCGIPSQAQNQEQSCNVTTYKLGMSGDIPFPGDYDGDGKAELAVLHQGKFELEILLQDGTKRKINLSKYKKFTPASFIGI